MDEVKVRTRADLRNPLTACAPSAMAATWAAVA